MLDAHVVRKSVLKVCGDRRFLGFWLVAVHDAGLHGLHCEVNARLRNRFERLVVKINDAVAAFDDEFSLLLGRFHPIPSSDVESLSIFNVLN